MLYGPGYLKAATWISGMLTRALRTERLDHRGSANMHEVFRADAVDLPDGVLGLAISEWIPGRSLVDVVADGAVRPMTVVQLVEPLAQAVALAHRQGMVLGCNDLQRIRVTPHKQAVVAFPIVRPETTSDDDVHGLGAVLYALLSSRWPQSGRNPLRRNGRTVPPPAIPLPGIPRELTALIAGTLGAVGRPGGVGTAETVHRVLVELLGLEQETVLLPPLGDVVAEPDDIWLRDAAAAHPLAEPDRRRGLNIGLAGLGAGLVTAGLVGMQMAGLLGDSTGRVITVPDSLDTSSTQVNLAAVEVNEPAADTDRIPRMVSTTEWTTEPDAVHPRQLAALAAGAGIMVSFATPVRLASLSILSPSGGGQIEVRSAPREDAPFDATRPIATAVLRQGVTDVSLADSQPVDHVLLRSVGLSPAGGAAGTAVTELSGVTFRGVVGCSGPPTAYRVTGWLCGQ